MANRSGGDHSPSRATGSLADPEPLGETADGGVDPTLVGASSSRTGSDSYNIGGTVNEVDDISDLAGKEPEEGNDEAIEDAAGGYGDTTGATTGRTVGGNVYTGSDTPGGASLPTISQG